MKKILYLLLIITLIVVGCVHQEQNKEEKYDKVNVYMIALSDNGVTGIKVGAEDSLIPVKVKINETTNPLKVAYEKLLSIKERNYGESGLYNPLYQNEITINKIEINKDIALVYLKGNLLLGGVMDIPRVKAQLENTALQFKFVKYVKIYINDVELDKVLSLKGE
jgi:hypothetical protein